MLRSVVYDTYYPYLKNGTPQEDEDINLFAPNGNGYMPGGSHDFPSESRGFQYGYVQLRHPWHRLCTHPVRYLRLPGGCGGVWPVEEPSQAGGPGGPILL